MSFFTQKKTTLNLNGSHLHLFMKWLLNVLKILFNLCHLQIFFCKPIFYEFEHSSILVLKFGEFGKLVEWAECFTSDKDYYRWCVAQMHLT